MKAPSAKSVRCAIYTRVSTDQGLDQEFNSLAAQYEASSAYIKSQAHAGWTLIRSRYDDGGYSGGSTDRPDLQRLLDDIRARKIDVIVVYKVDRAGFDAAAIAADCLVATMPHPPSLVSQERGFLDAETKPPKSPKETTKRPQRLKGPRTDSGNPRTNGPFEPVGKITRFGWTGWWANQGSNLGPTD